MTLKKVLFRTIGQTTRMLTQRAFFLTGASHGPGPSDGEMPKSAKALFRRRIIFVSCDNILAGRPKLEVVLIGMIGLSKNNKIILHVCK
jgi:hypothetical protein